jgi:C-terminal processing protease CtpA/Prc
LAIPFELCARNGKVYIAQNYSSNNTITAGDEILEINGLPMADIIQTVIKYVPGELIETRHYWTAKILPFLLANIYIMPKQKTIVLQRDAKIFNTIVSDITYLARKKLNVNAPSYEFTITMDSIGLMTIRTFDIHNRNKFKTFLDSSFSILNTNQYKNLIIDVRDNSGGNTEYCRVLINYFATTSWDRPQINSWKISSLSKKHFFSKVMEWYHYPVFPFLLFMKTFRAGIFGKKGSIVHFYKDENHQYSSRDKVFSGNVIVLANTGTYSAANDFVQTVKYFKFARVIGQSTGQPNSGFINLIQFELPHSHINAKVSFKSYSYFGTTSKNADKGLEPDILIESNVNPVEFVKTIFTLGKKNQITGNEEKPTPIPGLRLESGANKGNE